jgi:secretion/DNA translocation related TadE-like protein
VLVLVAAAVLMTTAGAFVSAARVSLVRQHAAAAADATALSAAATDGTPRERCRRAAALATANGTALVRCSVSDTDIVVQVEAALPAGLGRLGHGVRATARAGPLAQPAGAATPTICSSKRSAPALSNGSLPFPHLGDCTHDGQPLRHSHAAIASRVAASHPAARS